MKRISVMMMVLFLLCGCKSNDTCLERGLSFREKLLCTPCSFTARICADYGEAIYEFTVGCSMDNNGDVAFIVLSPSTISGISGKLTGDTGYLSFEDEILVFPLLADGEVSPVSAPWLLIKTLRSGYLSSAGMDDEKLQLTIHDSYEEEALMMDVWLNESDIPVCADIMWQGRRVLSIEVKDFVFM